MNNALLTYTQYSKAEFLKLSFWDITPPQYQAQEEAQLRELTSKGSFGPNRKEYIRKDGTRFLISIRGFILSDVDGRKLVWGIIEDFSQHSWCSWWVCKVGKFHPSNGEVSLQIVPARFDEDNLSFRLKRLN